MNALDLGELDDLVEAGAAISRALHAEDRAVQEDVLAAGELGVEAGADLEQRPDPAVQPASPVVGGVIRERILSSVLLPAPLWPMMPSVSPALDLEVDVPERPELLRLRAPSDRLDPLGDPLGEQQVAGLVAADLVALAEVLDLDGDRRLAQMTSAKNRSARRK